MSKASFLKDKDFEWFLSSVGDWLPEAVEEALRAGASVLAAEMKSNLRGEIADRQAVELVNSFGITPVGQDKTGSGTYISDSTAIRSRERANGRTRGSRFR